MLSNIFIYDYHPTSRDNDKNDNHRTIRASRDTSLCLITFYQVLMCHFKFTDPASGRKSMEYPIDSSIHGSGASISDRACFSKVYSRDRIIAIGYISVHVSVTSVLHACETALCH
jgi:hypothetical protein